MMAKDDMDQRIAHRLRTERRLNELSWIVAVAAIAAVILLAVLAGQCFGATVPPTVYPSCPRVVNQVGNRTFPCSGVEKYHEE